MKKIFSIIILFSIFLTSCNKEEIQEKKFYKTHTVWEWYISSKDSILSKVEWMNITDLSFKNPWRIKQIFVKKWDIVKSWQILAILSNEEANISHNGTLNILNEVDDIWIQISSIWNDTQKMKSSIESLYDGKIKLLENEYEKSEIAISLAEKDLDLAKSNFLNITQMFSWTSLSNEQKIKQTENALVMAKNNLENSKKLLESDRINIQKNAVNSLTNAYIIVRNARDYIDTILGITDKNKAKNDTYEAYLWVKNSNTKNIAESSFRIFDTEYEQTYKLYSDLIISKTDIPKDTLLNTLGKALSTLEKLRQSLYDTKDVLDNSITSSDFGEDTINGMQNKISVLLENLEQSILSPTWAWVKWSIEAINSFDHNYNLKIKQLEDSVNIALQDVDLAKTGKDISSSDILKNLENLKTNISIKKDGLNIAKIWKEEASKNIELTKQEKISKLAEIDVNLSQIRSKLSEVSSKKAEVQMNANLSKNSIESWIIKAPFDWIILDKNSDIWSVIWAWTPIFKISSNTKKYIKIFFDNNDYWLSKWSEINLKSERDWNTLTWTVVNINNIQDLSTNKNYAEIEVKSEKVQIGDRLSILLWKEKKQKQIIIPLNTIINKYSTPWVFVIQGGVIKFQIIKTKDSDDNFVAIEWLKIGDIIISDWKDNVLDGDRIGD